jgi:hypothetical protein
MIVTAHSGGGPHGPAMVRLSHVYNSFRAEGGLHLAWLLATGAMFGVLVGIATMWGAGWLPG